jgi:hypothetical protein
MTSLPYEIQENSSKRRSSESRPFLHNNFSEVDYIEDINEVILKIDSNDRNIDKYKDPFSFRVRFNQTESNYDAFGNAGPIILSKYDNIKYIKLVEAIIPRRNIVQEYNEYNKELNENSSIHNHSIIEITQGTCRFPIKLNKNDTLTLGAQTLTIENLSLINNKHFVNVNNDWGPGVATNIKYDKVKLEGQISSTQVNGVLTNVIKGTNTKFNQLYVNMKLLINNNNYLIANIVNDNEIQLNTIVNSSFENIDFYVVDSDAKDNANVQLQGVESNVKKDFLYLQHDKNVINDIESIKQHDIVLFDNINGETAGKVKTNVAAKYNHIELSDNLDKPISSKKFTLLPYENFDTLPGNLHIDTTNKKIFGNNLNFKNYNIGSILYLVKVNYGILKIRKINSESEIEYDILFDKGLNNDTPTTQLIYNYSFTRSSVEFSDERFILTNIKEFGNNTFEGTNENSSKAFGILFPSGTTEGQAYMSGLSYKLYNRRNLQNLNSLTVSFNDSYGNKLKLDHLDSSVDINDIRHPLNKDNQVHLTFRIGVVENRFD